jgi:hypothetical protein
MIYVISKQYIFKKRKKLIIVLFLSDGFTVRSRLKASLHEYYYYFFSREMLCGLEHEIHPFTRWIQHVRSEQVAKGCQRLLTVVHIDKGQVRNKYGVFLKNSPVFKL